MVNQVHLQNRLFALTARGALLRMAAAVGLAGVEQSHTYALIQALRAANAGLDVMLAQLSDIELKMLANDVDVGGSTRVERLERLLAFAGLPSAPAPASPAPGTPPVGPSATPSAAPTPASPAAAPAPLFAAPAPGSRVGPGSPSFDESFTLMAPAPRRRTKPGRVAFARLPGPPGEPFVAIDFETADNGRDSACAVALVRVEGDEIVRRVAWLIRTPRQRFLHTGVHGITWAMVANQPTFRDLWPRLAPVLDGVAYMVAHNAPFDRGVLHACCEAAGHAPPALDFECTVQMARRLWNPPHARLPYLCEKFGIPLKHHDAASDAEACARLVLVARSQMHRR